MSEFSVEVVRLGKIGKHPNADTLSITHVLGQYPVIVRTGEFNPGDTAVYVPVDSVVPDGDPRWDFLGGHRRIKAKRLRGIFSMGLLTQAEPSWTEGQNVQAALGIEKYVPPRERTFGMQGRNEHDPGFLPVYDLEGLRKWPDVLRVGEEVVLTEKIHGCNARFVYRDDRLWVASRTCFKALGHGDVWWRVAEKYELERRLKEQPGIAIFGEVYGPTQDLHYGSAKEPQLALFDALDTHTRTYYSYDAFVRFSDDLGLARVPVLHRGPWHPTDLLHYAEGKSTYADHVREGFVVKPVVERWDERIGRVALKYVGEGYYLRKEAK